MRSHHVTPPLDPFAPCGYCRRCAIHDDPGGCLTVEKYEREHGDIFVYGMLLDSATVPATLPRFALRFYGHATVEPEWGATAPGGIIEGANLARYDSIEGVRPEGRGYYERNLVTVDTADGKRDAWVYEMTEPYKSGLPSARYVAGIAQAYRVLGHDPTALDERVEALAQIETRIPF